MINRLIRSIYNYISKFKSSTKDLNNLRIAENRVVKSIFFMISLNGCYILIIICLPLYQSGKLSQAETVNSIFAYCAFTSLLGFVYLPYHPKHYGVNLNNLKYNLFWGLLIGLNLLVISILIRFVLIEQGFTEFEFNPRQNLFSVSLYPLSALSQEIVIRGFLQSYFFALFRNTKLQYLLSIGFSSIIFSAFHVMFGYIICILAFIFSIFMGIFYEKTRSLIGVFIIHSLTGLALFYF